MDPPPNLPATADSADSSPRCRHVDSWDEPVVTGAKLRLMCSYGGHIIPRPHDKSLCYVGGDTRMVVVERHSSLSSLSTRLSCTLLNGRHFTLKYQLPNEDLDSLISVTTDEDLDNMIEEYDRASSKPSRLRLFLFLAKPETATSMGSLLDDAKSETWFVDALNGAALLPRGLSDSATIDCLLGLHHADPCIDLEAQQTDQSLGNDGKLVKNGHEVHSMPDSSMVETTDSSFGSSSSSPSMSNLPPIKVRVEEQYAQMSVNGASVPQKQDDGFVVLCAPPLPLLPTAIGGANVASSAVSSEVNTNRVLSDDERSEQGVPGGFRKPPLPLQLVQRKLCDGSNLLSPDSKHSGGFNLHSPDSVASDSSFASATSLSKPMIYQDQVHVATRENRAPATPIDSKSDISDPNSQIQMQQVQESGYILSPQFDQQQQQQQFVHASMHYVHRPATGPVPISSYYTMYAPPSQQQLHHQIDHQFPMYLMPVTQTQPYHMSMQSNIADATVVASSRPPTPPNPAMVTPSAAYRETTPPIYPTKTASPAKPEMAASVYRTSATAALPLLQVPSNQFQQQYMGFTQMHHPSQSIATANYAFEYAHPVHDQVYYTQHQAAPLPSQYQTMTSAAAVALSEASTQLSTDNTK